MSPFGSENPRDMPTHFFLGALRLDYATALRANADGQNCSICPRYWYVDAAFRCSRCGAEFVFSAAEQRVWYEEYGFWVDARPNHCLSCRRELRELKAARREYDRSVAPVLSAGDLASKKRLAAIIDELYELGGELPSRINDVRRRLAREIRRSDEGAA